MADAAAAKQAAARKKLKAKFGKVRFVLRPCRRCAALLPSLPASHAPCPTPPPSAPFAAPLGGDVPPLAVVFARTGAHPSPPPTPLCDAPASLSTGRRPDRRKGIRAAEEEDGPQDDDDRRQAPPEHPEAPRRQQHSGDRGGAFGSFRERADAAPRRLRALRRSARSTHRARVCHAANVRCTNRSLTNASLCFHLCFPAARSPTAPLSIAVCR